MAATTYYITDPVIPIAIPTYTLTPASCPYELVVTSVTLSDNSALPGSITFDGTSTVNVQENTFTATGVYRVKVTVQDPKTLITDSTLEFDVTVLCTKSIDF